MLDRLDDAEKRSIWACWLNRKLTWGWVLAVGFGILSAMLAEGLWKARARERTVSEQVVKLTLQNAILRHRLGAISGQTNFETVAQLKGGRQ